MSLSDPELEAKLNEDLGKAKQSLALSLSWCIDIVKAINAKQDDVMRMFVQQKLAELSPEEREILEGDSAKMIEFYANCVNLIPVAPSNSQTPDMAEALATMKKTNADMDRMIYLLEQATTLAVGLTIKLASMGMV